MQIKQFFIALCALSLLFTACKKDDETSTNDFVGTWNAVTFVNSDCNDTAENGALDASTLACTDPNALLCTEISYVFKDDGTFDNEVVAILFGMDFSETLTGDYTVSGDEVELCIASDCITGSISGDQFTLTATDDPDTGCDVDTIFEKQ